MKSNKAKVEKQAIFDEEFNLNIEKT